MSEYVEHFDSTTTMRSSGDGQGEITGGGVSRLDFVACQRCGLPTGGRERRCINHPDADVYLRSIQFRTL